MRVLWHCESDNYCQRVIRKHWPTNPIYPDIRELRGADVEPVDVLCGGFPCQDISFAGAGAGIDGARSGLWSEYARLVGELRPRWVVVENVPALLGRGVGRVLGDLAEIGYDAEWDCLPASAFGAPHRRDRFWLVAYPGGEQHEDTGAPDGWQTTEGLSQADSDAEAMQRSSLVGREPNGDPEGSQVVADTDELRRGKGIQRQSGTSQRTRQANALRGGEQLADAEGIRCVGLGAGVSLRDRGSLESEGCDPVSGWHWATEPDVGRVAYGVPNRVDRLRGLGNALVPQIAQWIGERIVSYEAEVQRRAQEAA